MPIITKNNFQLHPAEVPLPDFKDANIFKIASFNTLYKHWVREDDFPYLKNEYRTWDYRLPRLRQIIENFGTDIICLQEIDGMEFKEDFGDYFKNQTMISYDFLDGWKKKNKNAMTTATLWRKNKFTLLMHDIRSRATILLFQENQTKKLLFVVNGHFQSGPMQEAIRFNQIRSIFNRLELHMKKLNLSTSDIPIIVIGDFNSGPNEIIDLVLRTNKITKEKLKEVFSMDSENDDNDSEKNEKSIELEDYENNVKFENAYNSNLKKKQLQPTYAGHGYLFRIDHCYYTSKYLNCCGVRQTLSNYVSENSLQLPNDEFVSDHLPIASIFEFTENSIVLDSNMILETFNGNNKKNKAKKRKMAKEKKEKNKRSKQKSGEQLGESSLSSLNLERSYDNIYSMMSF